MYLKKTKIICTIGPASFNPNVIEQFIKKGMDLARFNMSHGTQDEKKDQIKNIREFADTYNRPIAVIADLQGPKLRLGAIEGVKQIKTGEIVLLSNNPKDGEIPIQFDFSEFIKPNHRIYLNDGLIQLVVISVENGVVKTEAQNDGWISSFKGINIPDTDIGSAFFTDKDYKDATFALEQEVEFLALSFVRTIEDFRKPRELINKIHPKAKIIAKIERKEAIENLESIIQEADAVMIARGDLAIETSPSEVPILQQRIIRMGRKYQKPVIVATQMLESMLENPSPTRAEASDIARAVLSQVDAVMLSGESAVGKYAVEAVKFMNETIIAVEQNPEFQGNIEVNWESISEHSIGINAIIASAELIAQRINAKVIAVATASGRSARVISSIRPHETVVAATHDKLTRNQLNLLWGINPIVTKPAKTIEEFWCNILIDIEHYDFAKKGDTVVIVAGTNVGISGATDTIKVTVL